MSWDATLTNDHGQVEGSWNYTHNTNKMINAAVANNPVFPPCESWWKELNGMPGNVGAAMLNEIIKTLENDFELYSKYNPENGWGSYESVIAVLKSMRNSVPEWPTIWEVGG